MLPSTNDPDLPRPLKEILLKAMDFPSLERRLYHIGAELLSNRRQYYRRFQITTRQHLLAYDALFDFLWDGEIRNPYEIRSDLLLITGFATDEDMLRCLAQAEFETGHAAMEWGQRLEELRGHLERFKTARAAYGEALGLYLGTLQLARERRLLLHDLRRAKSNSSGQSAGT